jgi:PIN like domain
VTSKIYVENSVGRAIVDAVNLFTVGHGVSAVFQHDIHPQMQRPQKGDEWWIEDVARRGMAILTQDRVILEDVDERQAIIDNKARLIALGNGNYTAWQKLRCLLVHWDLIENLLQKDGPGAMVLLLSRADIAIPWAS